MKDILVFDGGLDAELAKYAGVTVKEINESPLWCSRYMKLNRDACVQAIRSYIRAGCDIIKTLNYQGSLEGFKKYLNLTEAESIELLKDAVYIAKDAIKQELGENGRKVFIAGVVGAYGATLHDGSEYRGEYVDTTPLETIKNVHKPTLDALVAAGCDIIFFITIPAVTEAELLLTLLKDYPHMKAIISFSCKIHGKKRCGQVSGELVELRAEQAASLQPVVKTMKDDQHISHGETLADAAEHCYKVNADQIVAIGVNCLNPKWVTPLFRSVRERLPDVGLCVCCNSGETYDTELKEWVGKDKCVPLTNYIQDWIDLDANYIGGCCRTVPDDIKSFRQYIDNLRSSS